MKIQSFKSTLYSWIILRTQIEENQKKDIKELKFIYDMPLQ